MNFNLAITTLPAPHSAFLRCLLDSQSIKNKKFVDL